jgi:hypothetical protein
MPFSVLIHVANEESILVDMEELPDPNAQAVMCTNVRRRDGKDVHYVDREAVQFFIPWHRIGLLEIIGSEEETEVISFVREGKT